MKKITLGVLTTVATLCLTGIAGAQQSQSATKTDIPAKLAARAKISLDSARAIAMAKMPSATITSQELEEEHGRLIYSFDMATAGKSGIDEVNVNALTGKVVGGVQHEGAASEAGEARMEKGEHHAEHERHAKKGTPKP